MIAAAAWLAFCGTAIPAPAGAPARPGAKSGAAGWLNWRGPHQNGTSTEKGLPEKAAPGGPTELWHAEHGSAGSPVIANGRLFAMGYAGSGPDLQELLACYDAVTGKKLWERRFNDFLSDIIYDRYAIASPTVDAETGNVYALTSAGLLSCFTPDGSLVWQHSMMEQFGRLTFPNGRTGGPLVEADLVITRGITSNWGADGPAMDRLYAFDKRTGGLVWSAGSGMPPKDNSFAMPVLTWHGGKRLLFTGTGCGHLVCVNARTGQVLWRYPISAGGLNASVVLHRGKAVAIHADENLDSSEIGRQVAVRIDARGRPAETGAPLIERSDEVWRNDLESISSSPVVVGDRIYQVTKTGSLCAVDANTGKVLWKHKLAPDQLHASPLYADGRLYIPMQNGQLFIVRPGETGAQELSKAQLQGRCLGAPAVWQGRVYVTTTERLYCFGNRPSPAGAASAWPVPTYPKPGPPVALQVIPSEVLLRPGQKARFSLRGIDANGFVTGTYESSRAKWARYIPPTARVRSEMNGDFNSQGELVAGPQNQPSAGAYEATLDGLKGILRGRVLPSLPVAESFEEFDLSVPHAIEEGVKFAYPPLPWIGARFKWEVRDLNGNRVLAKTLDNIFFQRATVFIGHPDDRNYTMEADVMTDGNRRTMSTVGLINQHYMVTLLGNSQELEVSSNHERIKVSVPFRWASREWYRLKTRVDVAPDGSGVVRGKAWKKGDPEPQAWTIEVPHRRAHTHGSPGLFGFAPQSLFRVYVDNISVTPNR